MATLSGAIVQVLNKCGEVSGITHHAVWNNQYTTVIAGETVPFTYPALFPEFVSTNVTDYPLGITKTDCIWRLHILHEQIDAGDGTLDQNLTVYTVRDAVKRAFNRFAMEHCAPFVFAGDYPDSSHNNVYHYVIEFASAITETLGSPLDPDSTDWIELPPNTLELKLTVDPEKPYLQQNH